MAQESRKGLSITSVLAAGVAAAAAEAAGMGAATAEAAAHASLETWARNTGKKQATRPEQGQGNMDEFHVSWFPGLLSLVSCW